MVARIGASVVKAIPGIDERLTSVAAQIRDTIEIDELHIDHRKIIVVDGRIAYCGGANIGAQYMFHVPFDPGRGETLVRAELREGDIVHLVEPEYHGDPASDSGCLAFYTFGWSLLDEVRDAGFADVRVACGWAPAHGYLGGQLTLLAHRNAA
jgi:hypothetical protein